MGDADISDVDIAVMCDIARASGLDLDADRQKIRDRLIADGLVEVSKARKPAEGMKVAITSKGQKMLDDRGVGVNES